MPTHKHTVAADMTSRKSWYRWVILAACVLIYGASHSVRWNYSGITKYLITDLTIGKPELGIMGAAFFCFYALAQVPWGMAVDTWGARKVLPPAMLILGVVLSGFAFSDSYHHAVFWRMGMGVFAAAGSVSLFSVISKWFSVRERGFALSLCSGIGGAAGEGASLVLIPVVAFAMSTGIFSLPGWYGATFLMGGVIIAISVAGYLMLRFDPQDMDLPSIQKIEDREPDKAYGEVVKGNAKDPILWLLSLLLSCFVVGMRLALAWIPLYCADFYMHYNGMSKELAVAAGGGMASLYILARCVASPIVGRVSDLLLARCGIPRTLIMAMLMVLMSTVFHLFTLPISSPILLGLLIFAAGAVCNSFPILHAASSEMLSVKSAGFNMAASNTVAQLVGAGALAVSGFMAEDCAVKGGLFHTEFLGIWYMGMAAGAAGLMVALFTLRREIASIDARV